MDEPRDNRQHQRDWASQQHLPAQQQRQKGAGREDIDDSDQAVDDNSAMLDEADRKPEVRRDSEV